MHVNVPDVIAAYFAAEEAKDSERLSQCFHDDAVVHDEGRDHRGIAAIKAWHRNANERYQYVVEPLEASVNGSTVVVHTRVTGNFPGNVAHLRSTFNIVNNQIASLEVSS